MLLDFNLVLVSRIYPLGSGIMVTNYAKRRGIHASSYLHCGCVIEGCIFSYNWATSKI